MPDKIPSIASAFCLSACHCELIVNAYNRNSRVFVYLLGLEGDPLLARFLILSRVEKLADVNERDTWVMISVTSALPNRVWE